METGSHKAYNMPVKQAWPNTPGQVKIMGYEDIDIDIGDYNVPGPLHGLQSIPLQKSKPQRITFNDSSPARHTLNNNTEQSNQASSIANLVANSDNMYSSSGRPSNTPVKRKSPMAETGYKRPTYVNPKKKHTSSDYDEETDLLADSDDPDIITQKVSRNILVSLLLYIRWLLYIICFDIFQLLLQ